MTETELMLEFYAQALAKANHELIALKAKLAILESQQKEGDANGNT